MTQPLPRIPLDGDHRLLVLTGAGISAKSGLATFRGDGGLWEDEPVDEVATPGGFARDPARVWRFYSERRAAAAGVRPNAAHLALAEVERHLGDRFLLVTQNVDGLHREAGSQRVVEVHGSLWLRRCSRCSRPSEPDRAWPVVPPLPVCDHCAIPGTEPALLRPSIVWFGEMLDPEAQIAVKRFILAAREAKAPLSFLAVGTSGNVYPAAAYVLDAKTGGATTWLANLESASNGAWFDHVLLGPATQTVPRLLGLVPDITAPEAPRPQ